MRVFEYLVTQCLKLFILSVIVGLSYDPKAFAELDKANKIHTVLHLTVNTTINPATAEYIEKGIIQAETNNFEAVLISLNTPGGLITSMQSIVEKVLRSKIPVIVYVSPSGGGAISAGVFITMAGHIAAMAPGTTIGAAHPVSSNGENIGEDMRHKAENFAASLVKAIAEQRGRNIEWAEKAVRESVALTDIEAIKLNVVDYSAENIKVIFEKSKGKVVKVDDKDYIFPDLTTAEVLELPMNLQQKVVSMISDPNVMAILGLLAMGGIMAELYNPGLIFPGLVGVVSLILTLVASQVIPISIGGLALLVIGALLISAEMFIPSFGVLGLIGIVCLILGSIYAIDTTDVWANDGFHINPWLIGSLAGTLGIALLGLVHFVLSARGLRVTTSAEGLIGERAIVIKEFVNNQARGDVHAGKVRVKGEIWNAYVDKIASGTNETFNRGDSIIPGNIVIIEKVEGLTLKVKKS